MCALLLYTSKIDTLEWSYQGPIYNNTWCPLGMRFGLGGTKQVATHTALMWPNSGLHKYDHTYGTTIIYPVSVVWDTWYTWQTHGSRII